MCALEPTENDDQAVEHVHAPGSQISTQILGRHAGAGGGAKFASCNWLPLGRASVGSVLLYCEQAEGWGHLSSFSLAWGGCFSFGFS